MNTLYRFFGRDGSLLYVGLTNNPARRFERHKSEKPWWEDVARIDLEQHPDRKALEAAERAAIQAEKPKHNVRMNGTSLPLSSKTEATDQLDGLIGRYFHSWREQQEDDTAYATIRAGRVLEWQGRVVDAATDDLFLVELLSWWDGQPNGQRLIAIAAMADWTFYDSALEMQCGLGCREMWGTVRDRPCGSDCSYVTPFGSTVCTRCASCYSNVQEIEWRQGKPVGLGLPTTLTHWSRGVCG